MDGIEKALMVAAELIYDDGRGSMQRIDAFVNNEKVDGRNYGHNRYNDGRAASQNFVVMVIKLVKMITDNDEIKTACGNALSVNAAGGRKRCVVDVR
jgi:hypothetical protein